MSSQQSIGVGSRRARSGSIRATLFALAAFVASAGPAGAADWNEAATFDIPAQSLDTALLEFSKQAGIQVLATTQTVAGKMTPGVKGELIVEQALDALLKGSGLQYRQTGSHSATVGLSADKEAAAASSKPEMRLAQADTGAGTGAMGVVAPAAEAKGEPLEEVFVRGKPFTDANVDIVRTEDDVQPYYIFKGQEISEATVLNVEQYLKQRLTMNGTAISGADYGFPKYSEVNLRGLGNGQTLILVNGRRVAANEPGFWGAPQFDLNSFDPEMIDRIEVLPSSASAIYGGSAVGGVVNLILKRDFTGGSARMTYDTPLDQHAPVRGVFGSYGWALEGDRTHITVSAAYKDTESLRYGDRPDLIGRGYARVYDRVPDMLYGPGLAWWKGSTANISSADGSDLVLKDGTPLGSALTYVPFGTTASTPLADLQAGLLANAGLQDLTLPTDPRHPLSRNVLEVENETLSVSGAIRRRMTDRLEVMAEVFYNSNDSVLPDHWENVSAIPYLASSPVNPFGQDVIVSGIARASTVPFSHESKRMVGGFVLDLVGDWRMQGDYTWNRSESSRTPIGEDNSTAGAALTAATDDGSLNLFSDFSGQPALPTSQRIMAPFLTAADRSYYFGAVSLGDVALRMSGPIGALPAGRPNLTIGLGRREERVIGGVADQRGYGRSDYFPQSQRIASVYAEGLVPLVSPANAIPGVRRLDLQVASRFEDFSVSSGTMFRSTFPPDYEIDPDEVLVHEKVDYSATNETVGLRYQPFESLTLRASYATAFLPPGFSELLPGVVDPNSLLSVTDPRRGGELSFVPYVPGGNPDLEPLDAQTWTVGLIFEPTFMEGLRIGIEWFQIARNNLAFEPSPEQILADEDRYPGRVTRDAAAPGDPFGVGPITQLDLSLVSAEHVSTEGFDLSVGYRHETPRHGTFSIDLLGTVVDSFTRMVELGGESEEVVNQVWNGGPLDFRANATFGWQQGNWRLSWTAMHYGSYEQYPDPLYLIAQGGPTVPSQTYHNLLVGYRFGPAGGTSSALADLDVSLGIRNVFDKLPPFDVGGTEGYYSPFGDSRLRSVQLAIGKRF
jgi:iron complex outermembrane receptor protein